MAKILITGGAGFIGAHLANNLRKNHIIMVVDNFENKGGIPFINKSDIFIKGNILDKKILRKIENWKPEIIYHLAAQSGGEGAYDNPKKDFLSNGFGTYLIANLAKKIKCKKLIYTSTVAVYGSNNKIIKENTKIQPDSIYGISKYAGEMFVKQLLHNTNVKTCIFRVFNTYGPGENLNNLKKGMVSIFCSYIWKKKSIIVKGSLNRFRNFTYIDDCAEILTKALNNKKLGKFEIINLTSSKKIKVEYLISQILKVNKIKKYNVKILKNTPGDSFGFHANNDYLKKKFPSFKFTTLSSGLKKYFKWINSLPKGSSLKNHHPFAKA
ncbi:NAD(P)-dependent oxidoreductase [Candidatus Pelagibacter bacterium]|nr:NAD(P)-dependent oxidoreductase [Candidatus Pelagibacter bacterium]